MLGQSNNFFREMKIFYENGGVYSFSTAGKRDIWRGDDLI